LYKPLYTAAPAKHQLLITLPKKVPKSPVM